MKVRIFETAEEMAEAASTEAALLICEANQPPRHARVVAATGTTQIAFLEKLVQHSEIDWSRVELFHLDEYIGLPGSHPASMQRYIHDRIVERTGITNAHLIDGTADPYHTCATLGSLLSLEPIDVTFAGIGDNGHLAFNDPPADFQTSEPYIITRLEDRGRLQQVRAGWFSDLKEVPREAITMSIPQILKSRAILCLASGKRKAEIVRECLETEIGPMIPASALRRHRNAILFLDRDAAAHLKQID